MAVATSTPSSWSSAPAAGYYAGDDRTLLGQALLDRAPLDQAALDQPTPDQGPAHEVIGEMARLLRDTRSNMLVGGGVLGAITIGIALEATFSARALRPGPAGFVNGVLLLALLLCWLRAVALLALSGRPVLDKLSELRWVTGAPLDSRPRWLTLPPAGSTPEEWTWTRAQLLVGAARLVRHRTRLADTWTYLTAAGFAVWTVVIFLGALCRCPATARTTAGPGQRDLAPGTPAYEGGRGRTVTAAGSRVVVNRAAMAHG
jgi:hypothetical protein